MGVMQNHTANELIAAFDADRSAARENKNRRARSAHQSALIGAALTGYARLAVAAGLVGLVASVVWGLS